MLGWGATVGGVLLSAGVVGGVAGGVQWGAGHPARPKRKLKEEKASLGAKLARMSEWPHLFCRVLVKRRVKSYRFTLSAAFYTLPLFLLNCSRENRLCQAIF